MSAGSVPILLTLVFVALKLLGGISWNWEWVFSPIWISILGILVALVVKLGAVVMPRKHRKRGK